MAANRSAARALLRFAFGDLGHHLVRVTVRLPRTTGVLSGLLVVLLGAWAGLIPFVGPYFDYGFTPNTAWHYSSSRLWLDILPAAAAVVGGLMMIFARRRATGMLGGWLAVAGGAWLIVGPSVSLLWQSRAGIGNPLGGTHRQAIEWIGYFYGVGALIVGLAALATGRFLSRPHVAERAVADAAEREEHRAARPARPSATEPSSAAAPQPVAQEPATASAAAPSGAERAGETERQPVAEQSPEARRAARPGRVEEERPAERTAVRPVRVRRRQGGLVGRLLGRRSRS
jgi:hypothetical protein